MRSLSFPRYSISSSAMNAKKLNGLSAGPKTNALNGILSVLDAARNLNKAC